MAGSRKVDSLSKVGPFNIVPAPYLKAAAPRTLSCTGVERLEITDVMSKSCPFFKMLAMVV